MACEYELTMFLVQCGLRGYEGGARVPDEVCSSEITNMLACTILMNCRKWADELGTRAGMEGTTFNSVSVGFTKTEAYNRIPEKVREELTSRDAAEVAVGNRIGETEDIAGVVGLLVSEKARVSASHY